MYRLLSPSFLIWGVAVVLVILVIVGSAGAVGVAVTIAIVRLTWFRFLPDYAFASAALDLAAAAHHVVDGCLVLVALLLVGALASPVGCVETVSPAIFVTKAGE